MAEVLGIAASVIALIQLNSKLVSLGYEYFRSVRDAPRDLRSLVDELNSLYGALVSLERYLRDQKNPQSLALQALDRNGLPHECEQALQRVQVPLGPKEGFRGRIQKFIWLLKEKETSEHIERIQRLVQIFNLALVGDQLTLSNAIKAYAQDTNLVVHSIQNDLLIEAGRRQKEETYRLTRERGDALDSLYPADFEGKHNEISGRRQEGTGDWILELPGFKNWVKDQPDYWLLWGRGIPGAGKTFLSSLVIDYLIKTQLKNGNAVCYIYFDYVEQDRQRPIHILASLVRQLVNQMSGPSVEVEKFLDTLLSKKKKPTFDELYVAFLAASKSFGRLFLVFDALDECNQSLQRKDLLPLFQDLGRHEISIFLTSRPYPEDIQISLQNAGKIELSAQAEDIEAYIRQRIHENPRAKRLVGRGNCRDRIISDIKSCANGMFLLVHFHIEHICQQTTVNQILAELENIKNASTEEKPLDPTYDRVISTIRSGGDDCLGLALKVLSWLVKAREILTVDGLRHAVSVKPNCYELDEWDLPDRETLLDVCAGLVIIDENSNTIRLSHYTVQEYLIRNRVIPEDANLTTTTTCIIYLSFGIFVQDTCQSECASSLSTDEEDFDDAEFVAHFNAHPFLPYAARNLSSHLMACDESETTAIFLKFLEDPIRVDFYLEANRIYWDGRPKYQHANTLGQSRLHLASAVGHSKAVYQLLGTGVEVSLQDDWESTALHRAALNGHVSVVKLLLDKGANFSVPDSDGCTPLYQAASFGHTSVVKLLLEHKADPSVRDINGCTPLYQAASGGHESVVEQLLIAETDCSVLDRYGYSALREAASKGHASVVKVLLERGRDCLVPNLDRRTALHEAAWSGHESVVRLLLKKVEEISIPDMDGRSALHEAVWGGHEKVVELLLEHKADISLQDEMGRSPLREATERGHGSLVKLLLEKGVNVSVKDIYGRTALHEAAQGGHETIVKLLLEKDVDCSARDDCGRSPLYEAVLRRHELVAMFLIENGADCSALDLNDCSILHAAAYGGQESILKLLLAKGANWLVPNVDGCSALHLAAKGGHESILELLLEKGVDISAVSKHGRSALLEAALGGHRSAVKLLLDKGASHSVVDKDQCSALHLAAWRGSESTVELLLERGADCLALAKYKQSALYMAAKGGYEPVVKLLLDKGADCLALDNDDCSALHVAASGGHGSVVKLLLDKGANCSGQDTSGLSALHLAALEGHESVVKLLLDNRADYLVRDSKGRSALHTAVLSGHELIVRLLLEKKADCSALDNDGNSALHLGASNGEEVIVQLLLENGAECLVLDGTGRSSLHLAAMGGHESVVELLLDSKADPSALDGDRRSALHHAAAGGHESVVELLLDNKADWSVLDSNGRSALHHAALGDHDVIVELLIEKGANCSTQDHQGRTPLHDAAYANHEAAVELLLENGANISILDNNGLTALQLASSVTLGETSTFYNISKRDMSFTGGPMVISPKPITTTTSFSRCDGVIQMLQEKESNLSAPDRETSGDKVTTQLHEPTLLGAEEIGESSRSSAKPPIAARSKRSRGEAAISEEDGGGSESPKRHRNE